MRSRSQDICNIKHIERKYIYGTNLPGASEGYGITVGFLVGDLYAGDNVGGVINTGIALMEGAKLGCGNLI